MAYKPDIRGWVILRYVCVQIPRRRVISAFVSQRLYNACPVARESGCGTAADL